MNQLESTPADLAALRVRKDSGLDDASLDTLAAARHALLDGACLVIDWHGANRDGDRHRVTIRVAYVADDYAQGVARWDGGTVSHAFPVGTPRVRIIDITKHITVGRWMSAARGSEGFVAVFGGGGTSPMSGTRDIVAHALGIDDASRDIVSSYGGR